MFTITKSQRIAALQKKLHALPKEQKQIIRKTFYDVGKLLVTGAKEEINKAPKHGGRYIKYYGQKGRLKNHQYYTASAPGEAPAKVTASLYDSIDFTVSGYMQMEFGVDAARHGVFYGKYLEYDNLVEMIGKGSSKIKPRPYLSASYKNNKEAIRGKFGNAIAQIIKK